MKKILFCGLMIALFVFSVRAQDTTGRWSREKAWDWYGKQPWLCGFNYIPAYAINYTAMWDKTSYDAAAIDKELALAQSTGMNVLRVVLQYAVYADDPAYFLRTLDNFLSICDRHGIRCAPAFFDDCAFGIVQDPVVGRQPEPLPGWYAWAWSPSPGHSLVVDEKAHVKLEKYLKAVMGRFAHDKRILFWDLYNEPTNGGLGTATLPLLRKTILWGHAVAPDQPLSICIFDRNKRLNDIVVGGSDIITFHNYGNADELRRQIAELKQYGRPIINTEWMNRPMGSLVKTHLAIFYQERIGCMLWGLVNGKTQTDLPWGHRPGDPAPTIWQHDLYHGDLRAYDVGEIDSIKSYMHMTSGGH